MRTKSSVNHIHKQNPKNESLWKLVQFEDPRHNHNMQMCIKQLRILFISAFHRIPKCKRCYQNLLEECPLRILVCWLSVRAMETHFSSGPDFQEVQESNFIPDNSNAATLPSIFNDLDFSPLSVRILLTLLFMSFFAWYTALYSFGKEARYKWISNTDQKKSSKYCNYFQDIKESIFVLNQRAVFQNYLK